MRDGPLVSVVIPVHDGERFLRETLQSVFDQTYRPIDVIVIDDGSTDDSVAVARSFGDAVVESQTHTGASAARNRGMNRARADLITFIDADDQMTQEGLTAQAAYIRSHAGIGCVFGHSTIRLEPDVNEPEWLQAPLGHEHPVPFASALFRTALLREAGGFDESRSHGEWFELFTRLRDLDLEVGVIDEPVIHYRIHTKNQSHQQQRLQQGMFRSLKNRLDRNDARETENS